MRYAVVHLVVQEALKPLIGPQVLDHMIVQDETPGADAPDCIVVGFLEPARHAFTRAMRRRLDAYRDRAPRLRLMMLPYTSRMSRNANARLIGARLRRLTGSRPVVFHCRTESAAEWAVELKRYLRPSALVLDVRGAWPEELLFARGFDGPDLAPPEIREQFRAAETRLRRAIDASAAVLTVSKGMLEYVAQVGATADRTVYVPCCVRQVTFSASERSAMRTRLNFDGKVVFAYAGTITRYQHIDDGLLAFFRLVADRFREAHLFCLTNDVESMAGKVAEAGIAPGRVTLRAVAQPEMPALLSAADAGVLLRAPSRMNRFSQPTKFAEYLAAGLPVIVARGTGILDELIEEHGAGIAIDWFNATSDEQRALASNAYERLRASGEQMRLAALSFCDREFLWSRYVSSVRAAYRRAAET